MIEFRQGAFWQGDQTWEPKISLFGQPNDDQNAICIRLDGTVNSRLQWDEAIASAQQWIEKGFYILWHLDLGLFDQMPRSIKDQGQATSLQLAVKHFLEVIWEPLRKQSIGLCLYQGSLQLEEILDTRLDEDFLYYQEQLGVEAFSLEKASALRKAHYAADVAANFLKLLTEQTPDEVPLILLFAQGTLPLGLFYSLASAERWERFICFYQCEGEHHTYQWREGVLELSASSQLELPSALLVPPCDVIEEHRSQQFIDLVDLLKKQKASLRLIADPYLIYEWHGLDEVWVASACTEGESFRRLQGFCAAGGHVKILGEPLGLVSEETL